MFALLALALTSPSVAPCLPRAGERMPLREDLRVDSEALVLLFAASTHEAEFRYCEHGSCVLLIHERGSERMGEAIELPETLLAETVSLPECFVIDLPEKKPKKILQVKKKKAHPPPQRDARPAPRMARVPTLREVIGRAEGEPRAREPAGLKVYGSGGSVDGAVRAGWAEAIAPGAEIRLDSRVVAHILEDGRLDFETATASQEGAGARGEGLNALDGADIAAPMKRTFADATFDARLTLHLDHRRRAVVDSLADLRAKLRQIRDDERLSDAEKRARIFALWNAPMDESVPAANELWATAAEQARSLVIDFVNAPGNFPEGPRGYTQSELWGCDAESRSGLFRPYGVERTAAVDAGL